MAKPKHLRALYSRSGTDVPSTKKPNGGAVLDEQQKTDPPPHQRSFPPPSIFQRALLKGILHRPSDILFIFRVLTALIWAVVRLHLFELPYHIITRFKNSSKQHPAEWSWFTSVFFSVIRAGCSKVRTMGQVRFLDHVIDYAMRLELLFVNNIKVTRGVQFKVNREILIRPERATTAEVREELRRKGFSDDPLNPSKAFFESLHPQGGPNAPVANMPEEVSPVDKDGTYTLKGEWIEALDDPKNPDPRPRSKTVILYFHGGAHVFCSPRSHTHMLARLCKAVGPGTRAFSVEYRLAPENPFPASIHDAFAAYLYLTEPNHAALTLDEESAAHELAVDPRDLVVGGDSAGGNLAAAFMLYMTRYVQPSTEPKFVLPHATLLLSPWVDLTSSVPAAKNEDWYCFCPGPIGTSPLDKKAYVKLKNQNYASYYLCGDPDLILNSRNGLGFDRQWEWYLHLVQHPLVSAAHSFEGTLQGMTNTLVQTATHDRLVDDSRLYAHRLGLENSGQLTRIEIYMDMVHVHQVLPLLFKSARIAIDNLARFIERSRYIRDDQERSSSRNGTTQSKSSHPLKASPVTPTRTFAAVLRKVPVRELSDDKKTNGEESVTAVPAFMQPTMARGKSAEDGVEWVLVEQNGRETAGDEGTSISVLVQSWPLRQQKEQELKEA
ncbi:MAG: Alpha/Beta hydrolase protein [Linnemannia gamsii]|nr:MAG: Alpha/Beta hydrolase protein [Linnemannia gamsii]